VVPRQRITLRRAVFGRVSRPATGRKVTPGRRRFACWDSPNRHRSGNSAARLVCLRRGREPDCAAWLPAQGDAALNCRSGCCGGRQRVGSPDLCHCSRIISGRREFPYATSVFYARLPGKSLSLA
jgi:hypothetical protein